MSNAQAAVSRNSAVRASGNLQRNFHSDETKAAALRLIKCLGLVLSFRNLYIIQPALEAEGRFLRLPMQEAANHVIGMALIAFDRGDDVDYFWFMDCRWRSYEVYRRRYHAELSRRVELKF